MQVNRQERLAIGAGERKGWRVLPWSDAVGCGKSKTNELIKSKEIDSVKIGAARVITTSPEAYLTRLAAEQDLDQ